MLPETPKPTTVLVVDDDPTHRHLAGVILKAAGYQVLTCENGREAIDYCLDHARRPDLILMDLQVPVLGGDEAAWFIRHLDATAGIPIIGLSEDMHRLADPSIGSLFDHLLMAPYSREALLDALDLTLEAGADARALLRK